jgi:hypothetical protein
MANRANRREPKKDRPEIEEASPPLLSEELIAELQGAVSAARSKRMRVRDDASTSHTPPKQNLAPRDPASIVSNKGKQTRLF